MMHARKTPLRVIVDNGELVIRIGVDVLASSVANGDRFHAYDDAKDKYIRTFVISNPTNFARDVVSAMLDEKEDGSSPLTDFLDTVTQIAIDDGSIGVEYGQEIPYGEHHLLETWRSE